MPGFAPANAAGPPAPRAKPESPLRGAGPAWFVALAAIRLYQFTLSPYFRGACRHEPSCSHYAHDAIARHGARGLRLALKRLLRCRPFGTRGYDPVP